MIEYVYFPEDLNQGLSEVEAKKRLSLFGKNEIVFKEKHKTLKLFLKQFKNIISIILIDGEL